MKQKFVTLQGLTPRKAILIGVLAIVFIIVVVLQMTPQVPASPAPVARRPVSRPVGTPQAAPSGLASPQALSSSLLLPPQPSWPEHSLDSILMHDPFAPPPWLTASGGNDREADAASADDTQQGKASADLQLLSQLQSTGVSLVMIDDNQRVAYVGERALRIGDKIGGFVVQEINTNGVTLAQDDRP